MNDREQLHELTQKSRETLAAIRTMVAADDFDTEDLLLLATFLLYTDTKINNLLWKDA